MLLGSQSGWFQRVKPAVRALAEANVFVGTSSWKYPGWRGLLYEEERYLTRGKFSEAKFEKECLSEYAELFRTVCVDAGYYAFPTPAFLDRLAAQTPADFKLCFKVTDDITLRQFPRLPRFGTRAGNANPHFLDAKLFREAFLAPCQAHQAKIGVLIFEFARFHAGDLESGRAFVAALDAFLAELPSEWQYAVEIRNRGFLQPEYFDTLARHGVAHVFNSWEAMPSVSEQMALAGSWTTDFTAARFLLKPGRKYEEAVKQFSPYEEVKEALPEAREAGAKLIAEAAKKSRRPSYVLVNNRLEGNALRTITAILEAAGYLASAGEDAPSAR